MADDAATAQQTSTREIRIHMRRVARRTPTAQTDILALIRSHDDAARLDEPRPPVVDRW